MTGGESAAHNSKGVGLAQHGSRQSRVIIETPIVIGRCNERPYCCDVNERSAAPADAKPRKSAVPQQLVANTKTERREVSGLAIRCHNKRGQHRKSLPVRKSRVCVLPEPCWLGGQHSAGSALDGTHIEAHQHATAAGSISQPSLRPVRCQVTQYASR